MLCKEGVDHPVVDALLQDEPFVLEGPGGCCTKVIEEGLEGKLDICVRIAVSFQYEFGLVGLGDEEEKAVHTRCVH